MDTKNPVGLFNSDLDLESYLSETVVKAGRNDEVYKAAKQRVSECKNRIPKLTQVLDLEKPAELSLEDCRVLIEYLLATMVTPPKTGEMTVLYSGPHLSYNGREPD